MNVGRRLSILLALAFALAACGSNTRTPAPSSTARETATAAPSGGSPDPGQVAVYEKIEAQVQALRGLTAKSPVKPVLLDSQGVRDWITRANEAQTDHQALAEESRLFIHLGLLPEGSSLEQLELDLQAGQVIGFYDTVSKGLYLLSESGGVGGVEKLTFSHEYTHALQDQNFGLDKLATDTADQGDRDLARLAVPEGDATLLMTQWMTEDMSLIEIMQVAGESLIGPQGGQMAKAPRILSQTMLFPYESGLAFVQGIYRAGGWEAVNQLYTDPPNSTSQILHPDLYAKRVEPVAVTVPVVPASLTGWKLTMQDTLGELDLRIWLEGEKPTNAQSQTAAAATSDWGGDRVGLYEGPNGKWAVVLRTQWRSVTGRAAFVAAANQPPLVRVASPHYLVCGDSVQADIYIGSDDETVSAFAPCQSGT